MRGWCMYTYVCSTRGGCQIERIFGGKVVAVMREYLAGRAQVKDTGDHKVPELQKNGQEAKRKGRKTDRRRIKR